MIEGIKHIIFDLGGVLLNIDYKRTEQAFVEAGIADFPKLYSQLQQTELFDRFETWRISSEEFITALRAIAPLTVTAEQIVAAWNAMILDYPLRRLQLLQQLRLYYDLVLLSNTNELHEHAFNTLLSRTHGMPTIAVFFDKVYLSHRVGMRKPDVALFRRVLDECGFKPEETLFIDDSPQHIEGAKQAGIRTILLEKGMTIEDNIFLAKEK